MERTEEEIRKEQARKRLEARQQRVGAFRAATKDASEDAPRQSRAPRQQQSKAGQPKLSVGGLFTGMLESYGLKFIAVLAIIALLVLSFFTGTFLRSCTGSEQASQNMPSAISSSPASSTGTSQDLTSTPTASSPTGTVATNTASTSASSSLNGATSNTTSSVNEQSFITYVAELALQKKAEAEAAAKEEDITEILEDELAEKLLTQAKINEDAAWIATHPNEYAFDGWAVQHKILKLAAEEPLARMYVRNWPEEYPATSQNTKSTHAITATTTGPNNIPQLFQWDPRWGYTVYSSTSFGMTGCCPTALAMVYQGLTGKTDMTPYDMGVLAENDGYMSEYEGTDAYFLVNEAPGLGLSCYEIYFAAESIVSALEQGQVLIANVGPGDFTTDGHFIVITGLKDGKLIVNDPYSKVRSDKLWDPQEIVNQSIVIFAYTKA